MNVLQDITTVIQMLTALTLKDRLTVLAKKDIKEMVLTAQVGTIR